VKSRKWARRDGLVAMHQIAGVGWHTLDRLLTAGWDPSSDQVDSYLTLLEGKVASKKVKEHICQKWGAELVSRTLEELSRRNIAAVTVWDPDYPDSLKQLPQPPWVLYVKGDRNLLKSSGLGVVGARKPTNYGKIAARRLAKDVAAQGWTVVSGLAAGIDGEAHRAALGVDGKTIAVLGSGVDVVYPKHHRALYEEICRRGAVVSEASPGTQPHPGLFPQRNRLISGLTHGTLVVEAAERSGSLITADCAMEQGREVFAVPGPITSELSRGTNRLIQQGAKCVTCVEDIWEEFSFFTPAPAPSTSAEHSRQTEPMKSLCEEERRIYAYIKEEPRSLEEIASHVEYPLQEMHRYLVQLQMKGLIRQLPGARFVQC
jgi:DNA processing protein